MIIDQKTKRPRDIDQKTKRPRDIDQKTKRPRDIDQKTKRLKIWKWWAAVVVAALAVFYFVFDPMEWRWMPQCVFHRVTGLQCAGCGSQRMLHALLHGDIAGAFRANAFVLLSLPAVAFLAWVETQRIRRPNLYKKVYSTALIVTVGILFAVWMVVRNLVGI